MMTGSYPLVLRAYDGLSLSDTAAFNAVVHGGNLL
jgi:hypothetical protein